MQNRQELVGWWMLNSKIQVEDGGLKAFVVMNDEIGADVPALTYDSLIDYLRQYNVSNGIDMVSCQQLVMSPNSFVSRQQLVAMGKAPVNGRNAEVELRLDDGSSAQSPRLLEDGRVDYFNLGIVRTVRKGDVLAVKTPPTEGVPGVSVSGAVLVAKSGKDLKLPQGKNTVISEDGLQLIADVDGHVSFARAENKVNVLDVFEVRGDVDFSVGNIDFLGNVKINGNVLPGFQIKAAGDIEVIGNVDSAFLDAAGDILVRGGVQMRGQGIMKAGGTVRTRFLQGSTVEAGLDVVIRDSIMHSNVSAVRNVMMEAQKSVIVGGLVRAGEFVRTRTLGSPMATPTEVEVGVHPHLRAEMAELQNKLKELYGNMEKTKKAIALLDNMAGITNHLPPDKEALRQNLNRTFQHYQGEEEEMMLRRSEIEAALLDTRNAKVHVQELLYPGIKLTLGQQVAYIRDELRGPVVYGIVDGELRGQQA